jgi:putative tryptophan/tyrosine transport system substrate-binding protein
MEIGRRGFLYLAGNAMVAWPLSAQSQQGSNLPTVAVLLPASPEFAKIRVDAIRKGLGETGLVEGAHYVIALRFADGQMHRLPGLARELQSLSPSVFVVAGSLAVIRELQPTQPVVFTSVAMDPVQRGFAQSYARPGGMVTGNVLNALGGEDTVAEKRISLFKELVPSLTRLGMFGPSTIGDVIGILFEKERAAGVRVSSRLGIETRAYRLKAIDDLEGAIASAVHDGIDGIYLSGEPLLINNFSRALPLIMEAGKPSLGTYVEWARQGVLMTYASDLLDSYRRAGIYAGKIIQGTKPGDLPIEQPTKFTLAINARTAKQLGINISTALQAAADELIE